MPEEEVMLICAPADTAFVPPGTKFDRFCSKCGRRVAIAPTGQKRLELDPKIKILCAFCFKPSPEDTHELAAPREEVAREIKSIVPNQFRRRN